MLADDLTMSNAALATTFGTLAVAGTAATKWSFRADDDDVML